MLPTAWLQNSKKWAERSERLMYEQSHRDYLRLVICTIVCLSWAVNHYRDNAITYKTSATKMPENWSRERGNYWHADASAWCCCARRKYTKELADAKAENDALRDDVAAGRRRLHIKAVCQSVREATTASGVDNAASPDWQIPLNGLFHPQREADHSINNWKEPRSILMSSADRVAHIDGQLMQLLWAIHALPAEYKCSLIKLSNPFTNVCWVSLLRNTFCAATNFIASISFLPNSRNEEMMGDGFFWCYCCRFVLNSKRLLSTSCNKQGQRSSYSIFFMVLPLMLFEVRRRIVCVEN